MGIISARDFRSSQTSVLRQAQRGEPVILSSRIGMFRIMPFSEEEAIATKIARGLQEVKLIREGKQKSYSVEELLDEL